ncbi:MAG: sulfatase-like hydrolase/transferase [Chitinophagales bacterium]
MAKSNSAWHYPLVLLKRIGIVLWLYALARLFFYFTNASIFPATGAGEIFRCFIVGLRFDISAIAYSNLPIIIMHVLPIAARDKKWYQRIIKIYFYIVNAGFFLLMLGDAEYYSFSLRHGTMELLQFMGDFIVILPDYLVSYWYLIPILFVILALTEYLYRRTDSNSRKYAFNTAPIGVRNKVTEWLICIIFLGASAVAMRGGLQKYPLIPMHAEKYVDPAVAPLATNTPFTIFYSITHQALGYRNYFSETDVLQYYHYKKEPVIVAADPTGKQKNIVIILLESFSAEYTSLFDSSSSVTPFLDSLMHAGLCYTHAYANALRSIDGVPAVLAGIPAQMDESFLSSIYQTNTYKGLGNYAHELGYTSAFFHGGHNGTFNLDNFSIAAGFDNYYGMDEYTGGSDADVSSWGIFDGPFLQFTAQQISTMPQPFCTAIFTLSSHHPYEVPEDYARNYPQLKDPLQNSVSYADHALQAFFHAAEKQDWYQNTVFIITADHCGPVIHPDMALNINRLHVPLIVFAPGDSSMVGMRDYPVQQIDILPTALSIMHYPKAYNSFGAEILSGAPHPVIGYLYDHDMLISDRYVLEMFNGEITALFDTHSEDPFRHSVYTEQTEIADSLSLHLKAFLQTYRQKLIDNDM